MSIYIDKIKEISKKLLTDGRVDMIIGFKKGTLPMINEPCLIKNVNDIEHLVWDSNCRNNLANYLAGNKHKVGIIAKGCDSRNVVIRIIENRIDRDNVFVIGVPCTGMIDKDKVASSVNGEIISVSEKDETIIIMSSEGEQTINKADVLQNNCSICIHRNPSIYDELVSDLVEEQTVDRYEDIRKLEGALKETIAYSKLTNQLVSIELAKQVIEQKLDPYLGNLFENEGFRDYQSL